MKAFGHFGEWLQGRLGPEGPVVLITLPGPLQVRVDATGQALFSEADLTRFFNLLGVTPAVFSRFRFDMPLGGGAGASTAALVALARWAGFDGPAEQLAQACIAVEGASDPVMFDQADRLLWASRAGRVVRQMPPPPQCSILGGFWGAPEQTDAGDQRFADVSDLISAWEQAQTLPEFADLSSESAQRCQAVRGGQDPIRDLAQTLGAVGFARAHTGSARALIFPTGQVPAHGRDLLQEAGFAQVITFNTKGVS